MQTRSLKKTLTLTSWLLINLTMATTALAGPSLEQILIKKGILTQQDLKKIEAGDSLEDILLEKGVISQNEWSAVKKEQTTSTKVAKQEAAVSEVKPESGYIQSRLVLRALRLNLTMAILNSVSGAVSRQTGPFSFPTNPMVTAPKFAVFV